MAILYFSKITNLIAPVHTAKGLEYFPTADLRFLRISHGIHGASFGGEKGFKSIIYDGHLEGVKPTHLLYGRGTVPRLDNPQHEAFAQAVAKGRDADLAYRKCYPRCSKASSSAAGTRLLGKVRGRVHEIQAASATATTLTLQEKREFHALLIRTPIGDIDETSILCQAVKYIESDRGSSKEFKVPDKLAAIINDSRIAGELIDKAEVRVEERILPKERRRELILMATERRRQAQN